MFSDQPNSLFEIFMIKNAIGSKWKRALIDEPCKMYIKSQIHLKMIIKYNKRLLDLEDINTSKSIYDILVLKQQIPPSTNVLWQTRFENNIITSVNVYKEMLCKIKVPRLVALGLVAFRRAGGVIHGLNNHSEGYLWQDDQLGNRVLEVFAIIDVTFRRNHVSSPP